MILVVDSHSGVPVFRQIVEQVRFHVASGLLEPGEELPSTRSLSTRLGVNPMTVSKAFRQLVEEDIVERRPGLPLVVSGPRQGAEGIDRAALLRAELAPVVTTVRQLGLSDKKAVKVFRKLLAEFGEESR